MTKIKNETQYNWVMSRIEELLGVVTNDTPRDDPKFIELEILSNLSADYADQHYSVGNLVVVEGKVVERKKKNQNIHIPKFRSSGKCKYRIRGNYILVPINKLTKRGMSLAKI